MLRPSGGTGDLFVLDMGKPVRIVDLARDLVRLAGRDPDSQPIELAFGRARSYMKSSFTMPSEWS